MQPSPKLQVAPDCLIFNVDEDTKKSLQTIRLTNPDTRLHIFFKIRTTGRVRYVVKPNSGIVAPQANFDISIAFTLPVGEDLSKPIKDKFVVYSMVGYKSALEKEHIDQHLTENLALCDKFNVTAIARLASTSNGIKQSLNVFPSGAIGSSQVKREGSPRFPRNDPPSGKETELLESAISRSQNASKISNNSKFTKMIESMKQKASEISMSASSRPLAQTLPVKFGEKSKAVVSNPAAFEAQIRNDVFFESTNKMLAEDTENSQYIIRPDKSFGYTDSIRSAQRSYEPLAAHPSPTTPVPDLHLFATWQLLLALIIGTIIGAFFNGK